MTNAEKLHKAIVLLLEVDGSLDRSGSPCGECGLVKKRNFAEHKASQELQGAMTRIARVVEVLEGEETAKGAA